MSTSSKENWMNSKWRPAMGWMYMIVCVTDFVIFPILWSVLQAVNHGSVTSQWQPLTLQGAGLFHIAMGAIVGVTAWSRGQEKLGGVINGGITLPSNVGATYTPPGSAPQPGTGAFGTPTSTTVTQSWGSAVGGGFQPGYGATPPVTTGIRGKAAPVQPMHPEI